jgi:hypothetical protein
MKIIDNRIPFDAANASHRAAFKSFYINGSWGIKGCPFSEPPMYYESIPGHCRDQLLDWYLIQDKRLANYE